MLQIFIHATSLSNGKQLYNSTYTPDLTIVLGDSLAGLGRMGFLGTFTKETEQGVKVVELWILQQ